MFTIAVAELIPPPLARLSRATTWNVIVRVIAGRSSPVRNPPMKVGGTLALFKIYCSEGNVRVPPTVGEYGRNIGLGWPSASVFGVAVVAGPRSYSSQS